MSVCLMGLMQLAAAAELRYYCSDVDGHWSVSAVGMHELFKVETLQMNFYTKIADG